MSDAQPKRPLYLQTIETLFAELISGESVVINNDETLRLDNNDSRAILNWYRLNRSRWASNVMTQQVEALVDAMSTVPPTLPVPGLILPDAKRRLRLAKVVAHRFAGIHAYGTPEEPPANFVFEASQPITLFEGWNGAGKTSLLNAIVWCLTGQILRPQRPPEDASSDFDTHFRHDGEDEAEIGAHPSSPVTPMPNPLHYVPTRGSSVPADTWVELTFVDQDGKPLPALRRAQVRKPNGKISEIAPDFAPLAVDPISLRIGTVMPALLSYLRVGEASDLGLAAAKLTGLADLSHLARHAMRVRVKLHGELKDARESEIQKADAAFLEARGDLESQIAEYDQMKPPSDLPQPSGDATIEQSLGDIEQHFTTRKAEALTAARSILGEGFVATDKAARDNLEASIGPAQGQLRALGQLRSAQRFKALTDVAQHDWKAVDDFVDRIEAEAKVLAELSTTPDLARRKQLYARVASWIADFKGHDTAQCAVCSRPLADAVDPVTQRSVADHLHEIAGEDKELLALTISAWAHERVTQLTAKSPAALRQELGAELPGHPRELIRAMFVDDLFDTEAFSQTLAPLKSGVEALCDKALKCLPAFVEPPVPQFPQAVGPHAGALDPLIRLLRRAKAFSDWRANARTEVAEAFQTITRSAAPDQGKTPISTTDVMAPIGAKLAALHDIVKGVAPINAALELMKRMRTALQDRRGKEKRLELYKRAAAALGPLARIGDLAERQVEGLRTKLHGRADYWRNQVYANAYATTGYALRETAMDARGVLDIRVGSEAANAPAQHVSNASALRASLLGFYLAFWEHVLAERGGLALLLLDDPQELLDTDNRERLARALPALVKEGAQIFLATHDRVLARSIAHGSSTQAAVEHLSVHPVNATRQTLATAIAIEQLDAKHRAFENDPDDAPTAQDYASEVRVFLEARLGDMFDDPAYPAYAAPTKAPTLADHINRLRGLVNAPPNALFRGKAVVDFATSPHLAQGTEPLRVLNTSHHDKATLSAGEIAGVADALDQLRKLGDRMHAEFRHWRWQEPLREPDAPPTLEPLGEIIAPKFSVLVHPDLAAFTASAGGEASQDTSSETLQETCFADKTLFYLRTDNLGFAAPSGAIAIVERSPYVGKDHNLVIARQGKNVLARRLLRAPKGDMIGLASEAADPREAKPTLFCPANDLAVHRVAGILFDSSPPPQGKGEAIEIESTDGLQRIQCAYRVVEESAVPLALPGQVVLGGAIINADEIETKLGELVALTLKDGRSIFKRIGKGLDGDLGPFRLFESIGGLGDSLIVAMEEIEGQPDVATFAFARSVVGVLYDV